MILVIESSEKDKYRSVVDALFRQRYDHFVVRRNWSIPCKNNMDIDQYDVEDAVYFASIEDDGAIVGSVRLNKTTTSSLLTDLFPFLVETGESTRGPTIFEGSRFIVSPRDRSAASSRRVKAELLSAVVDYCLDHGGTEFQAVIDAGMLPTFVEMSLHTRVLGLPQEYGGGVRAFGGGRCVAYRWTLSTQLLADLQSYGNLFAPALAGDQRMAVFQ